MDTSRRGFLQMSAGVGVGAFLNPRGTAEKLVKSFDELLPPETAAKPEIEKGSIFKGFTIFPKDPEVLSDDYAHCVHSLEYALNILPEDFGLLVHDFYEPAKEFDSGYEGYKPTNVLPNSPFIDVKNSIYISNPTINSAPIPVPVPARICYETFGIELVGNNSPEVLKHLFYHEFGHLVQILYGVPQINPDERRYVGAQYSMLDLKPGFFDPYSMSCRMEEGGVLYQKLFANTKKILEILDKREDEQTLKVEMVIGMLSNIMGGAFEVDFFRDFVAGRVDAEYWNKHQIDKSKIVPAKDIHFCIKNLPTGGTSINPVLLKEVTRESKPEDTDSSDSQEFKGYTLGNVYGKNVSFMVHTESPDSIQIFYDGNVLEYPVNVLDGTQKTLTFRTLDKELVLSFRNNDHQISCRIVSQTNLK